ncbi:MAG: hypothetical protein MUP98_08270 [Candidatus Aminicenantes bacterium]|nr:hypothetical protein [Candidatus Aminicenantes bacterium]
MNQTERMNRSRKNLLKGILWGSGIWTVMLVIWIGIAFNGLMSQTSHVFGIFGCLVPTAVLVSILILLFFLLKYWRYKWKLRKDPQIRSALDDERLRLSWFKAYRFAFFAMVIMHGILVLNESIPVIIFHKQAFSIPQQSQTHLTLLVAVLSCIGSFLHHSREE